MRKIAFFCIPANGHVNPTLEVVRRLTQAGHQVRYYCFEAFREKIEGAGAGFVPCDSYGKPPEAEAKIGQDIALSIKVLVDTTLALDEPLCADLRAFQPDCVVADSMAVWGKAIAMKLGVPFVSSTTTFAFNQYSAKIMGQSASQGLKLLFSLPRLGREVKRLKKRGYPVKSFLDLIQNSNDTNTIVYTSKEFQPCSETFSDRYAFVGPSIPQTEPLAGEKRGKVLYISMGTVNNQMPDFYKNCMEAFEDWDGHVILSVGQGTEIGSLGPIPENFTVKNRVDQLQVLQQADVFLTHCGMNSVSEGLYYQVPLVLYPQTPEQNGVARRVADLGAGVYLKDGSVASLREAVDTVLKTPSCRENAGKIAESFHNCGGAELAAQTILSVMEKKL